jgi:hypothetical protein
MRVGILTFHSQINYGALLQAYAMQLIYRELGCEPVIIDRWLDPDGAVLSWRGHKSLKEWIKDGLSLAYGIGVWSRYVRYWKTKRFLKRRLRLTSYHFHDWKDAPEDLGVDLISVGSDQVWNARLFPVAPYFLDGAPEWIPAIAYAASMGMPDIPETLHELYSKGVRRFRDVSVREKEGERLLAALGVRARQVADPTLLLSPSEWSRLVGDGRPEERKLLVYVLAEDVWEMLPAVESFAGRNSCSVVLLVEGFERRFGKSVGAVACFLRMKLRLLRSPVRIFASAGPVDFVREIKSASWIVSNSYHALMFSVIFRRQIRIMMPHDETRKGMHARMAEFSGTVVEGPLMQRSMEEALASIERGEEIGFNESALGKKIEDSRRWLNDALEKCRAGV